MLLDIKLGVGVVAVMLLAGIAGQSDYEMALLEERAYCANVALYHASAGEQGWPDYRLLYNSMCAKYSSEPEMFL